MDGEIRRSEIIKLLLDATKPTSATTLAKKFQVSRQIIVGDIALLRASGKDIEATARGYLYDIKEKEKFYTNVVVCDHQVEEMEKELQIIVKNKGIVKDVIVEHPIYGEIRVNLELATESDVVEFMQQFENKQATLLSALTSGVHLHTILCENETDFLLIKKALSKQNIIPKDYQ